MSHLPVSMPLLGALVRTTCGKLFNVVKSPGDGHCFIYSIANSLLKQHNHSVTHHEIISKLFIETTQNMPFYAMISGLSSKEAGNQLSKYLLHKIFNSDFVDIIPIVTANALKCNVCVLDQRVGTCLHDEHMFTANRLSPARNNRLPTVFIQRVPNHYNGLTPRQLDNPTTPGSNNLITQELESQKPEPTTTPTSHQEGVTLNSAVPLLSHQSTVRKYSSEDLLSHRHASVPLPSLVKETIKSLKIGKHRRRGCRGGTGRRIASFLSRRPALNNPYHSDVTQCTDFPVHATHPVPLHQNISVCVSHRNIQPADSLSRKFPSINLVQILCSQSWYPSSIALLNCQSVRNKYAYISDYIIEHDFDCVALTETWLTGNDSADAVALAGLIPDGYAICHTPRVTRGGGVALLHRKSASTKKESSSCYRSFESLTTVINLDTCVLRVVVVYRVPPSTKNKLKKSLFLEEFSNFLEHTCLLNGKLLVVGDFNIHWDNEADAERKMFTQLLQSFDLQQHVSDTTHIKGHTIDMVISRSSDDIISECRVSDFISDHSAVIAKLKCSRIQETWSSVSYRKVNSINATKFSDDLRAKLAVMDEPSTSDAAVSLYNEVVSTVLNTHAPVLEKRVKRRSNPWITENVLQAKRKRRASEVQWRKTKLTVHRLNYKENCEAVRKEIKKAKSEYFQNAIASCGGDQKKLFSLVNSLLGREKPTVLPKAPSLIDLVDNFNSFFITKIANIRNDLQQQESSSSFQTCTSISTAMTPCTTLLDSFDFCTEGELEKILKSVSNATCSLDPAPTRLIKQNITVLCGPLLKIINLAFATGVFPSQLKTAIVKPLLKKINLDPEVKKNYRPVSNEPEASKLIEKVMANRLYDHLSSNNLLEEFQSAYKPAHSTETALIRIYNDLLCELDKGRSCFLVLLDLSSAFDTVDHDILLNLMSDHLGVKGTALDLLRSYLSERTQRVVIRDSQSSLISLKYGVPQGSVLGPLLFCIYLLPLGQVLRDHGMCFHMYADDTQLYVSFAPEGEDQAVNSLHGSIASVRSWMKTNKLKLNDDKTEFLVINTTRKAVGCDAVLRIGESEIRPSANAKNLGVTIDSHLSMQRHITNTSRSCMIHLRNISSIRSSLSDDAAAQLIHSLVSARLDYCNSLLYGLPASSLKPLQRVQNYAARILTKTRKFDHITPILKCLHWLPVKSRILFKVLLLTFKSLHNKAPTYLSKLLKPLENTQMLRSNSQKLLFIPKSKSKLGDRAFSTFAAREWNKLPFYVRNIETVNSFKSQLKTYLFNQSF